jgi:microcompartment protein CcmK/EutM
MYFGKVIGSVWATQKDKSLLGEKLMLVRPINSERQPVGRVIVVTDAIGAGFGETVMYVTPPKPPCH